MIEFDVNEGGGWELGTQQPGLSAFAVQVDVCTLTEFTVWAKDTNDALRRVMDQDSNAVLETAPHDTWTHEVVDIEPQS